MTRASVICVRVNGGRRCHLGLLKLMVRGERDVSASCLVWRRERVEQQPDEARAMRDFG
jgi:hypothetical protein